MSDDWLNDRPLIPEIEVPEHTPVKTGLVDVRGKPIARYPRRMGFHTPGKAHG